MKIYLLLYKDNFMLDKVKAFSSEQLAKGFIDYVYSKQLVYKYYNMIVRPVELDEVE